MVRELGMHTVADCTKNTYCIGEKSPKENQRTCAS